MATLEEYKGSIDLISGLRAKNNGTFPLMEAHDILVGADDLRLDEKLANMGEGGGGIIDVTSLPTENIDEKSIYRVADGGAKIYFADGTGGVPTDVAADSFFVTIYVVDDAQNQTMAISHVLDMYAYVDKSTGVAYVDYGSGAMSAGTLFGSMMGVTVPDNGWVTDSASATEFGLYAIHTYTYHAYKDGVWVELYNEKAKQPTWMSAESTSDDYTAAIKNHIHNGKPMVWKDASYDVCPLMSFSFSKDKYYFYNGSTNQMIEVDINFAPAKISYINLVTKSYVDSLFGAYITDIDTLVGGDS